MSITWTMASLRRTGLILSAVVAVVVAGGVGIYLPHAQASARDKLRDDFAQRAAVAAKLTGGALASSERDSRAFARRTFEGPERTVQAAVDADQKGRAAGAHHWSSGRPTVGCWARIHTHCAVRSTGS